MIEHEKVDALVTYFLGWLAALGPIVLHFLSVATTVLQFLISVGGFLIVFMRYKYERKKHVAQGNSKQQSR